MLFRILNGQRKVVNKKIGKQTARVNKGIARPGPQQRRKIERISDDVASVCKLL